MTSRWCIVWLLAGLVALSGCSTLRETREQTEQRAGEVRRSLETFRERYRASGSSFQVEDAGIWLGADAVRRVSGEPLPEAVDRRNDYAVTVAAGPVDGASKRMLRTAVAELLGFPVIIDPVTLAVARDSRRAAGVRGVAGDARAVFPFPADPGEASRADSAIPGPPGGEGGPAGLFLEPVASVYDGALQSDFVFHGSARDLLDSATAAMGLLSWRFDGKTVWLAGHEMREFPLHVVHGGSEEGAAGADGGAGSSRLEDALSLLRASCGGCRVESLPSLGVVQVRALPQLMPTIERVVGDLNRRLTEQYAVEVSIYSVRRTASQRASLDLDFAFTEGSQAGTDGEGSDSSTLKIFPRKLYSAEAVFDGLSEIGRTSEVFSSTVLVLSGETQTLKDLVTSLVRVGSTRSAGQDGNVLTGAAEADVIETLTDGFELDMRVQSLGHGRVLLSYRFERSDVLDPQPGDNTEDSAVKARTRELELENTLHIALGDALLFNAFETETIGADASGRIGAGTREAQLGAGIGGQREVVTYVVSLRALALAPPSGADPSFRTGV